MNSQRHVSGFGSGLLLGLAMLAAAICFWPVLVTAGGDGGVGRYQISSWASYAGQRVHHSGYYILDTATGKVVDRHEVHGISAGSGQ